MSLFSSTVFLALLAIAGAGSVVRVEPKAPPPPPSVSPAQQQFPAAETTAKSLQATINLLGYDPIWDGLPETRFKLSQFRDLRSAGFTAVRINLLAFAHMDTAFKLDPAWVERVNDVTNAALSEGLTVILDEHDHVACRAEPWKCADRLAHFWVQFAPRFAHAPPTVVFEIMNEPGGPLSPDNWNVQSARALGLIRLSNPRRTVVIGPACSNDLKCLDMLALPLADRQIIVTFHYYVPLEFTHQGTIWNKQYANLSGIDWGSQQQRTALEDDFSVVSRWAQANDRPIFLGEFGANDSAPEAARLRYVQAVTAAASHHHFSWGFWQFEMDFALYNMKTGQWDQKMLKALFGDSARD